MTDTTRTTRREVTLSAATFVELLDTARAAGRDGLREHGRNAGRLLAERLLSPQDGATAARTLPATTFWKRVNEVFASRGWGSLAHEATSPGVAELRSTDWIEAERQDQAPDCAFTTGVIQGLLAEISGAEVEVRETECRGAGGSACRFRFGSRGALDATA